MTEEITLQESARLVHLERKIETGLSTFIEVGEALLEIRDSRLYRIEHGTFEEYCRVKWGMSRTFAFYQIEAAKVSKNLNVHNCEQKPATESQARPLTKLPPEDQPKAWEKAVEIAGGEQPTAKQVEEAVIQISTPEVLPPEETNFSGSDAPEEPAPAEGMMWADKAIRCLEKIQRNDKERKRAMRAVSRWITSFA